MLLDRLSKEAAGACSLDPTKIILVGVSGGADSLCLLDGLHRLGYQLVVAHFDHQLRKESRLEAHQVARMAEERGIPFVYEAEDVAAYAVRQHLSMEEAARLARYRFLFAQARLVNAQAVAVGHTADDQCETVLMHFLRGSGLSGLRGMQPRSFHPEWDAEIPLVRPLLGIWRTATQAYCQEHELQPVHDASNEDPVYFRNRLRLELIPTIEQLNPRFKHTLLRTAQILAGDEEVLQDVAAATWHRVVVSLGENYSSLNVSELTSLQPGLQRRVIRQAIQRLVPGLRDIDFEVSELVSALAGKKSAARPFALVDDILTLREAGTLFIYKGGTSLPDGTWPQLIEKNPQNLVVPGHLDLKNGWLLVTDFVEIDNPLEAVQNLPPQEVWLDVDCLHLPLQVRALRPGDRFQPIGMLKGTIKVSDFFTNQKVPPRARQFWPLVYSGDSLIWIAGLRTAQHTSLTTHTRRVARLRILEPGSSDVSQ